MSIGTVLQTTSNLASSAQSYLNNNVNAFVSPKNSQGLCGWLFDIPKETTIRLTADVTDNYTESGSYINDHIVKKPIEITLTGFVGELVYTAPKSYSIRGIQRQLQNKLTKIDAYIGKYTDQTLQKIQKVVNTIDYVESRVNQELSRIQNITAFFSGETFQLTKQAKAYRELYSFFEGHNDNKLLNVMTPYGEYDDMIITSLTFTQIEDTEYMSDISITLKQMRFAKIETTTFDKNRFITTRDVQESKPIDNNNYTTSEKSTERVLFDNMRITPP